MKKLDGFNIELDRDRIMMMLDCAPDCAVYEQVLSDYERVQLEFYDTLRVTAAYHFTDSHALPFVKDYEHCVYSIYSLGFVITEKINECFDKGEYLDGMMLDRMADNYLGSLKKAVSERITADMNSLGFIHSERFTPFKNISHEYQTDIVRNVDIGLSHTSGYMIDPVKSGSFILGVRKPVLTFNANGSTMSVHAQYGENILNLLQKNKIHIAANCGGNGTCGKCRIKIESGKTNVDNIALACKTTITGDAEITVCGGEADFDTLRDYHDTEFSQGIYSDKLLITPNKSVSSQLSRYGCEIPSEILRKSAKFINSKKELTVLYDGKRIVDIKDNSSAFGIAIDIGTTTIVLKLIDLNTGDGLSAVSALNSQRAYGADVISRIQSASDGKLNALRDCIVTDLLNSMTELIKNTGIDGKQVYRIVIAGNTTMLHLLLGIGVESFGRSPYTPVLTDLAEYSFSEVFGSTAFDPAVTLMPSVSAFVGADISSGIYNLTTDNTARKSILLIDIGTNGEMALCLNDKILCVSTAAGPAFEGGNISCGCGSVQGAIRNIRFANGAFSYETIGGKQPVGICGSGVISLAACLIENGLIDETGAFCDEVFSDGAIISKEHNIIFMQKDIRELQLAKSAIRAGIEVLLASADTIPDTVFIAGGFGWNIDLDSAVKIGLIPSSLRSRVVAAGNSSLGGCVRYLKNIGDKSRILSIAENAREIDLASNALFNELYMEHMYF